MSIPSVEYFLSELDHSSLPTDVFFGDVVYEAGGTYGPRLQTNYQLLFISSGHARIEIDGRPHDLAQRQMAFLKPGHREFFRFAEKTRTHHRWCHFDWQLPDDVVKRLEQLTFGAPLSGRMEHLCDLGLSLQHDPYAPQALLQHLAAAAFWEFFGVQSSGVSSVQSATLPVAITRVQTYVVQHYADDLSLKKLGRVASVSPEHLSRLFRRHLDTTPINYLWRVRTQQGAVYLRHTGLTVETISYRCGFKTAAHFSRSIKYHYGLTPSQIRTRHWQSDKKQVVR